MSQTEALLMLYLHVLWRLWISVWQQSEYKYDHEFLSEDKYGKCPKILYTKFSDKMDIQTFQTQIRLLLKEQPDQVLYCLPFH